jgi:hypothetical protein
MRYLLAVVLAVMMSGVALAKPPKDVRAKFYDFGKQVIDGHIKTPTVIYTGVVQRAKFDRLLRLKKSFLSHMQLTSKEAVFK